MRDPTPRKRSFKDTLRDGWFDFLDLFLPRWRKLDRWIEKRFGDEVEAGDNRMAQAFKPDAVAIEEAPVPVAANAALYVVLTLLVVAILWAILGSVDRIVVAPGKVATRTPLVVMSPFTTSRIQQIAVKAGDHVRKGQLLVAFDPAFAQADVATQEHKVRSLSAQVERLEAQLGGQPFQAATTDNGERQTQAQIYDQEMATYSAEMSQRDSRIGAIVSQLTADTANISGLQQQVENARKIADIHRKLLEEQAGSRLEMMSAESSALDYQIRLKNTQGEARKLGDQRAEIEAERRSFLDKWRSDHNQQLVQARQDLAEASETLTKALKMKDLTRLTAPAAGTVLEIADRSEGSVLREAETLVTMVPDKADLYIEAKVMSRDISYLKVGNEVRIKLETYPFQRYGTLHGRLEVISADSVPLKQDDGSGKESTQSQLVYRVQVRITDDLRGVVARGFRLRPGLVASAEIKTGKRSIASYILNPILRTADEGLREP
jgi:hemolysin D